MKKENTFSADLKRLINNIETSYTMRIISIIGYAIFWIVAGIFFYGISLIPCYYLIVWAMATLPFPWFLFVFPTAFFLFIIVLILITGIFKRLFIPKVKEGNFTGKKDVRQGVVFIANRWIVQYVMVPFHSIVYTNDLLCYICLRLYGVRLHYSTHISTDLLSDFSLLKFGKNTMIGGYTTIYGHISPGTRRLILASTEIGDDCFIGSASNIGCGCKIGNKVFIGYDNSVGLYCKIGNNCQIEAFCKVGMGCRIEEDVVVGSHSILANHIVVKKGIRIPKFSDIPDYSVIDSQEKAQSFCKVQKV